MYTRHYSFFVWHHKTNKAILLQAKIHLHSFEHMHNRFLNGRDFQTQFSTLCNQLGCIQFIIRSSRSQHLRLLLQREVLVRERFVDVLLVQIQNLVVRDHSRIRKVVYSLHSIEFDSDTRQSWSVNSILIGRRSYRTDIEFGMFTTLSYLLIFVMKFRGERSSEMGMRTRRISTFEYTFWSWWWAERRKRKPSRPLFWCNCRSCQKSWARLLQWSLCRCLEDVQRRTMGLVGWNKYFIDATRSIDSAGNVSAETCVCQSHSADNIDSDREKTRLELPHDILLVGLTPVDVRSSRLWSARNYYCLQVQRH